MKALLRGGREVQNLEKAIAIFKEVCKDNEFKKVIET